MMISNAGDPLDESPHTQDWLSLMQRIVGMIHRQAENNRVREFMAMAKSADPADRRHLVYWPLRNSAGRYPKPSAITLTDADLHTAQHESVRLWSLKPAAFNALVRHGYTLADSATASYPVAGQLAAPAKLPI
jgi:NTE family protein